MLHCLNLGFAILSSVLIFWNYKPFLLCLLVPYKVKDTGRHKPRSNKNKHSKLSDNFIKITAISIKASVAERKCKESLWLHRKSLKPSYYHLSLVWLHPSVLLILLFFFFFSPENNTFIMGYLHVCKCRTAACLQRLKQASSNKIVSMVQWQGRNLVSRSSLGSQQEQLREMRSSSDWCLQVMWKVLVLVCAENFVWQQRSLSRDGNAPLRGRHCPSWRVSGAPGSHQRAKLNAGQ